MLKAVAFDLWETLITNTPELSRAQESLRKERLERVLRDANVVRPLEQLEDAHRRTWLRCQELYWSSDLDVPCRRQVEHFLEGLDVDPASLDDATMDALEDAYARVAVDVLPHPVDGAKDVVVDLKSRGFRVGLISNTGRTPGSALREILHLLDLGPFLDAMVFSNEHGACKPRTSIFESLRDALGVDADEILFVGDNLYVDVLGAQRCRMRGVHFIPPSRGTAVAPAVEHGLEIVPDAVIRDLREVVGVVARLRGCAVSR